MDQIASLITRGLISPDAAQSLLQKVSNVKNNGWLGTLMEGVGGRGFPTGGASGKPTVAPDYAEPVPQKPVMSDKDKKTTRYRIIERARNPERGNAGQVEEQRQAIEDSTDKLFQEAADHYGMPLRNAGKTYYPRGQ